VYVCLEEFVRDIYPLWWDGATVSLTVEGIDTDTGEERTVSGVLRDVVYSGQTATERPPTLAELSGQASMVLWTPTGRRSIGGWGALIEDLEARRITLDRIDMAASGRLSSLPCLLGGPAASTPAPRPKPTVLSGYLLVNNTFLHV
jgi:hypothetical protein